MRFTRIFAFKKLLEGDRLINLLLKCQPIAKGYKDLRNQLE